MSLEIPEERMESGELRNDKFKIPKSIVTPFNKVAFVRAEGESICISPIPKHKLPDWEEIKIEEGENNERFIALPKRMIADKSWLFPWFRVEIESFWCILKPRTIPSIAIPNECLRAEDKAYLRERRGGTVGMEIQGDKTILTVRKSQ